jgi:molybdopterin molybdotransferase
MGSAACSRARLGDVAAWIDAWTIPVPAEEVPLAGAAGRVAAADIVAAANLPPFDRAAADGLALRAGETVGAGAYNPLPFRLVQSAEGVAAGRAVAVESGDALPAGADAVVRLEHAMPDAPGTVAILAPAAGGSEVERAGSQAARGSVLVGAGRRLAAAEIGLLASAGVARVAVVGRPRVRCLLLAAAGAAHDANGPILAALVARDGGVVADRRALARDRASLRDALASPGADVVLLAGGTGAGAGDAAAAALAEAGEIAVHGVALRPGETSGAGRTMSGVPVLLLPGTPAACLWAYELIAGRAIRRLAGGNPELPFAVREMGLRRKIVSEIGMTDICPVRCLDGGDTVEPLGSFAERGLVAAVEADGFVIVPEASEGYAQGARLMVHLYPGRSMAAAARQDARGRGA